jgi:hypothetical protein
VKVNKWQVALPGLFLKFRLKQVQSDQSETVVYAYRNVGNVKLKKKIPPTSQCFRSHETVTPVIKVWKQNGGEF